MSTPRPRRVPFGSNPEGAVPADRIGRAAGEEQRPQEAAEYSVTPTPPEGKDVSYLLDALAAAANHEYEVAERLDRKTGATLTFAGAFFAVVQAAAIGNLAGKIHHVDRNWMLAIGLGALVALAAAGLLTVAQAQTVEVTELSADRLNELLADAYEQAIDVPKELAKDYVAVVESYRRANDDRLKRYRYAVLGSSAAILLTCAELAVGLAGRI